MTNIIPMPDVLANLQCRIADLEEQLATNQLVIGQIAENILEEIEELDDQLPKVIIKNWVNLLKSLNKK